MAKKKTEKVEEIKEEEPKEVKVEEVKTAEPTKPKVKADDVRPDLTLSTANKYIIYAFKQSDLYEEKDTQVEKEKNFRKIIVQHYS